MKESIFIVLILATSGCKLCHNAINPEDCIPELKNEIADKWKEYKDAYLDEGSFYWRNDDFAAGLS